MAYQPLYGKVSDNQGYTRGTSCLRGKVNNVSFWLNSWFGEVAKVNAHLIDGKEIIPKPDLRRIKKEERKTALEQYEEEVNKENKVILDIDIPANKHFAVKINGILFDFEKIKLLEEIKLKRMDMQIEQLRKLRENEGKVLAITKSVMG